MAEIWVAGAITLGGAVISGVAAEKKAKGDRKAANEDRKAATKEEAQYGAILSQFEREQEDYYNQMERQRKQRGLDQFRQFSTVHEFAPNYADNNRITLPNQPNVNTIMESVIPTEQKAQGGGKGKSLHEKLDPLGTKLLGSLF